MFLSMQSLNGDSYQGAQVGANVQSQVGPTIKDSSWLSQRRELSLSCLCTEPSTVQSEAPKVKPNKRKKENRQWAKARCRCEGTSNYDLCYRHQLPIGWQCCLFRFGWNILAAKIYSHPPAITPPSNSLVTISNVCRKHLALTWTLGLVLGWFLFCFFFFYCVPPLFSVFLYCCLIRLLCVVVVFHTVSLMQPPNRQEIYVLSWFRVEVEATAIVYFFLYCHFCFFHRHRSKCNTSEHASDAGVSSLH